MRPSALLPRALLAGALLAACGQGEQARGLDRDELRRGVASDERVVAALHRVDELALGGKPDEAVEALKRDARPASRQSVEVAQKLAVRTAWGHERAQELRKLVDDRAGSLDAYTAALESKEAERLLKALEEQKKLDLRGAALAEAVAKPAP